MIAGKTLLYEKQEESVSFIDTSGKEYYSAHELEPGLLWVHSKMEAFPYNILSHFDNSISLIATRAYATGYDIHLPKYDLKCGTSNESVVNNPTFDDVLNWNNITKDYPTVVSYTFTLQDDGKFNIIPTREVTSTIEDYYEYLTFHCETYSLEKCSS